MAGQGGGRNGGDSPGGGAGIPLRLRQAAARTGLTVRQTLRGLRIKPADRLLIAPQELEPGDPSAAVAIYSGQVVLAGRTVHSRGESIFRSPAPDLAWAQALHGFAWLRHFRDTDNSVIRHHARALVAEWLTLRDLRTNPIAQQPGVVADRMIAWLVHAPLLIGEADHGFYARFMRSLARDSLWLEVAARRRSLGLDRLHAAIAYAAYTICANLAEDAWLRGRDHLVQALGDTVLADGTPISRNPADALALMSRLLQLRTAYTARGKPTHPALQTAIDRLFGFIKLMRHPDGALALFNGMGATDLGLIGAILAFDDGLGGAPASARFGGYHRLECASTVVIVDAGDGPPANAARAAHAGALSLEFSSRRERIVVNCGAAPAGLTALHEALRETPAHSTLTLGRESSARFRPAPDGSGRLLVDGTDKPKVERMQSSEGAAGLSATHDGYRKLFGLSHARRLILSADGEKLAGIDALAGEPRNEAAGTLRFHLHPRVTPAMMAGETAVALTLGDGSVWMFEASGNRLAIEESLFMGGLSAQRTTRQIVLAGPAPGTELRWSFRKAG